VTAKAQPRDLNRAWIDVDPVKARLDQRFLRFVRVKSEIERKLDLEHLVKHSDWECA
jgi:hypothetical protein